VAVEVGAKLQALEVQEVAGLVHLMPTQHQALLTQAVEVVVFVLILHKLTNILLVEAVQAL
jgi:hypothetical protein